MSPGADPSQDGQAVSGLAHGWPVLLMFVRSFSTSSRPACGRPPAAAVLGRQQHGRLSATRLHTTRATHRTEFQREEGL